MFEQQLLIILITRWSYITLMGGGGAMQEDFEKFEL